MLSMTLAAISVGRSQRGFLDGTEVTCRPAGAGFD
jgi:hypothetical protein